MKAIPNQIKPNKTILWLFTGVFDSFLGQNPPKPNIIDLKEHIPWNYTYVRSIFYWSHSWTNSLKLDMLLTTCGRFSVKRISRKDGTTPWWGPSLCLPVFWRRSTSWASMGSWRLKIKVRGRSWSSALNYISQIFRFVLWQCTLGNLLGPGRHLVENPF